MPWSGGTYTNVWSWVVDSISFPNILASRFDTYEDDQASGINNCLTKDGQNVPTANLPMSGFIHTGVGNASARNNYPSLGQVQDGSFVAVADTGSANTYVLTLSPAITAYATNMVVWLRPANTNTGASTVNINSVGAKNILIGATALTAGQLTAGRSYALQYDGTSFQLIAATISTEFPDNTFRVVGSVDDTKKLALEVDGITTATTRTLTVQDVSGTVYVTGGQDIAVADGGTNISSYAVGDVLYASGTTTLSKLAKGTSGQRMVMNTGETAPSWFTSGQTLVVQDQKASGTAGGGSTAGSWLTRVLNTSITNTISGASLGSNQITLPAGTYRVQGHGTFFQVGAQNRFYNITDATEVVRGNTAASGNANSNTAISAFSNTFTITGTKVFELQYRSNTTNATNSLGLAATLGVNEIYAHVEITKISD